MLEVRVAEGERMFDTSAPMIKSVGSCSVFRVRVLGFFTGDQQRR